MWLKTTQNNCTKSMRLITTTQKIQNRTAKITASNDFENGLTAFAVGGEILTNNRIKPQHTHP